MYKNIIVIEIFIYIAHFSMDINKSQTMCNYSIRKKFNN